MEAYICGVTISVMMCAETMVVGVLGGGTTEGAALGGLKLRLASSRECNSERPCM